MKRNKSGISLIVLVITVIVMIILAGSVIISLSNSGIIGKANEAVDANNLKQVQQLASLAWSEAYIDKMKDSTVDLKARVEEALAKNKVDQTKYVVTVTEGGVSVNAKTTLGALVTSAADYGKIVDYTVTVDGETHKDWKVLYEDEVNGRVFIIASESVEDIEMTNRTSVASLTTEEKNVYSKFQVGNWAKHTLIDEVDLGGVMEYVDTNRWVASIIKNYTNYANIEEYGSYVEGAIGAPTIELIAASWNAFGKMPKLTLTTDTFGYNINNGTSISLTLDNFLAGEYWLASPSSAWGKILSMSSSGVNNIDISVVRSNGIRPVVCLKSDIPAIATSTGYSLIK